MLKKASAVILALVMAFAILIQVEMDDA